MKIVSVLGTRPQIIKASVLHPELEKKFDLTVIDTGQHYDDALAGQIYRSLGMKEPDYALVLDPGVAGKERKEQMVSGIRTILYAEQPDLVLVYGDTDSTVAATLAAGEEIRPVAHVEAGLRSFNSIMPEELNRILVDHMSMYLFAPTPTAVENLRSEGISKHVFEVGDLMEERLRNSVADLIDPEIIEVPFGVSANEYLFATIHRAENREAESVKEWAALLNTLATAECPVLLALHPGTEAQLKASGEALNENVRIIEPQDYLASIALQLHSRAVITDSGGIQREAAWLGVPCLVLRNETEWVEAVAESNGKMLVIGKNTASAAEVLENLDPNEKAVNKFNLELKVYVAREITETLLNALEQG
jgi:UDP-GlcNAc3NAcA epimerase